MSDPAIDLGPHRCHVEDVVRAQGCHDAFEYHACSPPESLGPSPGLAPVASPAGRIAGAPRAPPRDVADLGHREEAPLQCLILPIGLAQSQGGSRLHHLVTQIEGVRRVADAHLGEQPERVGIPQQMLIIEGVDQPALGEDPPVRVANPPLELGEIVRRRTRRPGDRGASPAGARRAWAASDARRRDGPAGGRGRSRGPTTAPS